MSFIAHDILENLDSMSRSQIDYLPFGAIKVDGAGVTQIYNRTQAQFAGIPPNEAEGRNWFTDVAPCANNRMFFGRFQKGVEAGKLDAEFRYTFTYKLKPTIVSIKMFQSAAGAYWIFVRIPS